MEREIKVKSYKVKYVCDDDECKHDVVFTGEVLTSFPPLYIHKCESCGKKYNLRRSYPYITTKEVGKWSNI